MIQVDWATWKEKYPKAETWLDFFAEAVRETAAGAVETASTLVGLFRTDRERIGGLGRGASSALRVHHELQRRPLSSVPALCRSSGLTPPTVGKALTGLESLDIVREVTGRRRNRVFAYDRYLALLSEGTQPTPRP